MANFRFVTCLLVLFIVVTVPGFVDGESCKKLSACSCECEQGIIDLTDLGTTNGPRYRDVAAPDTYKYSYNPCDPFTETNGLAFEDHCHNVAACQIIDLGGTMQYYDTGVQDSVTFYTVSGADVGIVDMTDDVVVAKYISGDNARETDVILVCNDEDTKTAFDTFGEVPNAKPLYRHILVTPLACWLPASALSGGTILICIVIPGLVAYFLVGVIVNKFALKKAGTEVIPQATFWLSLPGLIKDGCLFVISRGSYKAYAGV